MVVISIVNGGVCSLSMELLREIRETEEKARKLKEQAKTDYDSTIEGAKTRSNEILREAKEVGQKRGEMIFEASKKDLEEANKSLENKYQESIEQHQSMFEKSRNEAVKLIIDSILHFEE